jgi:hypothetical protein
MQENYVMRKNIIEIEQNLIRLAKLPGLPIQQADVVCWMTVSPIISSIYTIIDDKPMDKIFKLSQSSTHSTKNDTPADNEAWNFLLLRFALEFHEIFWDFH